jgi:hypothetical protein
LKEDLELSSKQNTDQTTQDFISKNILVESSKSGKMIDSHLRTFSEHISGESVNKTAVLLGDPWTGHKDSETMKVALPSKHLDVLLVPEIIIKTFSLLMFFSFGSIKFT